MFIYIIKLYKICKGPYLQANYTCLITLMTIDTLEINIT